MECRNRLTLPKPGNRANSVGAAERLMVGRFDWWTNCPPLHWERTQKPFWPSTFSNEIDGDKLRLPCSRLGRPKLVCQSSLVRNDFANPRLALFVESSGSTTTIVSGWSTSSEFSENELVHERPPILSGVLKLEVVFQAFLLSLTLSGAPFVLVKNR